MPTFSLQVNDFIKKTRLRADLVIRKVAFDALRGVIRRSPVKTGRYRASHRLGVNLIDRSVANPRRIAKDLAKGKIKPAKKGAPARPHEIRQAETAILMKPIKAGDVIYISNNLPYARRLEEGRSRQAPGGVYGPTITELKYRMLFAINAAKREAP